MDNGINAQLSSINENSSSEKSRSNKKKLIVPKYLRKINDCFFTTTTAKEIFIEKLAVEKAQIKKKFGGLRKTGGSSFTKSISKRRIESINEIRSGQKLDTFCDIEKQNDKHLAEPKEIIRSEFRKSSINLAFVKVSCDPINRLGDNPPKYFSSNNINNLNESNGKLFPQVSASSFGKEKLMKPKYMNEVEETAKPQKIPKSKALEILENLKKPRSKEEIINERSELELGSSNLQLRKPARSSTKVLRSPSPALSCSSSSSSSNGRSFHSALAAPEFQRGALVAGPNVERQCLICCTRDRDSLVIPCGHGGFCSICLVELFETGDKCPICRAVSCLLRIGNSHCLQSRHCTGHSCQGCYCLGN